MKKNFYYGSLIPITNNDVSYVRPKNVFWIADNTSTSRHPYLIANGLMHEKNPAIYAWIIDSKPYCSDMVPILMNDNVSYINPFKMVMFKRSDIRREYWHGSVTDSIFNLVFNMYKLMFDFDDKAVSETTQLYREYLEEFFTRNSEFMTTSITTNDNPLVLHTSIIDFDVLKYLKTCVTTDNSEFDTIELNEKDIRDFYVRLIKKEVQPIEFVDNMSDDDKILFIGLKKLYKVKEICSAINAASATYYNKLNRFKNETGIGEVFVKLENSKTK